MSSKILDWEIEKTITSLMSSSLHIYIEYLPYDFNFYLDTLTESDAKHKVAQSYRGFLSFGSR